MTTTDDREANRWEHPPVLCSEGAPVSDPIEHMTDADAPWLWCCLPPGHEPPHYDYERRICWFKPEADP
jgi:hypothetical protein